jgi:two-component system, LytTR family, response regulator
MNKIRTLIIDDEPLAREGIRLLLQRDPEIEITGECSDGKAALKAIKNNIVDLLFLDIQMPEMNGFEVLKNIRSDEFPAIIFVTAYDKYALEAFKYHALDYLLKPFNDEQFYKSLSNAKEYIHLKKYKQLSKSILTLIKDYDEHKNPVENKIPVEPEGQKSPYLNRIPISIAGHIHVIKVNEIDWIEAADYYAKLHVGNKTHLLRETMINLEVKLDPSKFIRIHRSTIVNIDRITELEPYFNGEYYVILNSGQKLKLSRSYKSKLKKSINFQKLG